MKRVVLIIVLLFLLFNEGLAHKDRAVNLKDNGELIGLPQEYMPTILNLDSMSLSVKDRTLQFPPCISKYFLEKGQYRLEISGSWSNERPSSPPLINFLIFPNDRDFEYQLLFSLKDLRLLRVMVVTYESEKVKSFHEIKIDERCEKAILNSYH